MPLWWGGLKWSHRLNGLNDMNKVAKLRQKTRSIARLKAKNHPSSRKLLPLYSRGQRCIINGPGFQDSLPEQARDPLAQESRVSMRRKGNRLALLKTRLPC